jgi:hypothetical protein|tara:strand:- start:1919 stop:2164 length:246 start_codon:yes stop_codon:yes gene_type:complete
MTTFQIGQKIRSYDFVSRTDCYVEGLITSICNSVIEFTVTKSISEGAEYTDRPDVMRTVDLGNDLTDRMYEELGRQRIEAI